MTSRRYKWQGHWEWDSETGTLHHTCGLQVRFGDEPGPGQAINAADIMPALVAKNGGHNAPLMLQRMLGEAAQLRATLAAGLPLKSARMNHG